MNKINHVYVYFYLIRNYKVSKDKMHIKAFIGQGNTKRLAY